MVASSKVEVMSDYVYEYSEDFFFNLRAKGSSNTEKAYRRNINQFIKDQFGYELKYLIIEDLRKINYKLISDYFRNMYEELKENGEKKYKNSTLNNKLTSIKEFIKYMKFRKIVEIDLLELDYIKSFSKDSESHETVPMNIVLQMLENIKQNEDYLVNEKVWFIKIAVETGLRMSEVLRLTKDQFYEFEDYILIKSKSNRSKGNKDWKEKVSREFYEDLREELFKEERQELFNISQTAISEMLNRTQERLGIGKKYSPHSFKRTAVNNTKQYTNDSRAAMRKGKHSNESTTNNHYIDDVEHGATGYFSMQSRVDNSLYSKVSHQELLEAINNLDEGSKLKLNSKLQELRK